MSARNRTGAAAEMERQLVEAPLSDRAHRSRRRAVRRLLALVARDRDLISMFEPLNPSIALSHHRSSAALKGTSSW